MPDYEFIYKDTIFCGNEERAKEECMKVLKDFIKEDKDISDFCKVNEVEY